MISRLFTNTHMCERVYTYIHTKELINTELKEAVISFILVISFLEIFPMEREIQTKIVIMYYRT